jgi:hypothetical protein
MNKGSKLGGCTTGDFDPRREGEEVAVVSSTGEVFLLSRDRTSWTRELVFQSSGEMIQCAGGDFLPEFPGDELIFAGRLSGDEELGSGGAAYLAWHEGNGWRFDLLLEDEQMFHAVAVADVDPATPGVEILLAGYGRKLFMISRTDGGRRVETVAELPGAAKDMSAAVGKAVIACDDGSVIEITHAGTSQDGAARFIDRRLLRIDVPLARIALHEGTDGRGEEVLVCGNDGELRLLHDGPGEEMGERIFMSRQRLRGAVIAEVEPARPGPEYATAGYDGKIWVVHRTKKKEWVATAVGEDSDRLHHLAAGRIGPARWGTLQSGEGIDERPQGEFSLVACGYSGRVLVVRRMGR